MLESQVKLDQYILNAGTKAIYFYKQRSKLLKGDHGNVHSRTVNMINYHFSELLRKSPIVPSKAGVEDEHGELVKPDEREKLRTMIANAMVKEEWTPEAMHLVD